MATIIICIMLAVFFVLGIRRFRKNLRSGCCGSEGDAVLKKIKVKDHNLRHYPYKKILDIDGMTCGNCATHVQNALNSLDGVFSKVDLSKKKAAVYMKNNLSDQLLLKTVAEAGYTVISIRECGQGQPL